MSISFLPSSVRTAVRLGSVLFAVVVVAIGCTDADRSEDVVVYVSVDQAIAEPILARFTERTGIGVRPLFDTEATKTTGLANRIRREADRPRADVFWSSEPFAVHQLATENRLGTITDDVWGKHPAAWRDPDGRWIAFAARGRVIAYDPSRLERDKLPQSWLEVGADDWAGQVAIADPRFGTTRGHLGALRAGWGPEIYGKWVRGMNENDVKVLPGGNAATVDAVVRGEVLIGLTDTDDVLAAQARGLSVEAAMLEHDEAATRGGTLMVPNSAGIVAGTERPGLAIAFLDFLASEEVERMLHASTSGNFPLVHRTGSLSEEEVAAVERAWDVPIPVIAQEMDVAVTEAMDVWGGS